MELNRAYVHMSCIYQQVEIFRKILKMKVKLYKESSMSVIVVYEAKDDVEMARKGTFWEQ